MKKNLLVYTFALFSIVFSSCGGDGDSAPKDATSEENQENHHQLSNEKILSFRMLDKQY